MIRAVLVATLALAGCGRDERTATNTAVAYEPAVIPGETAPPMAWRYAGSDEAPEARFGAGADSSTIRLICARDEQTLRVRHAPVADAAADAPLVLATGGQEKRLPVRARDGALEGEVLLADPFVAAMAAPAARILIAVGAAPPLDVPGGAAIRRIVEACRSPVAERLDGAVYAGPSPDGSETMLMFEGADPGPGRAALLRRTGDGGAATRVAGAVVVEEAAAIPVYRFEAEAAGGETLWFEAPRPGVILLRGPNGVPDPALDASPLTRRR